ncbi:outer dynein arm-docking complex subunit 4-like [Uloborus diversus]|uniref:outer dynein arm-docking complex subunit 4-like n=1 Tax=Uloborus diversus TaxID=327109 RepID=UPI002409320E|nr:outer dynein arm-docking complex subunit 4-like [Uloborus diversus]
MDEDEEETEVKKGPKFSTSMYISQGSTYLHHNRVEKAIACFNTALEKEPNNLRSLIYRSKCYMRMARFQDAYRDAETALRSNSKSCEAKALKGEAEYFLGDFERALLTFRRAERERPNFERFRFGQQMSRRAIDNALQPDDPMTLGDEDTERFQKIDDETVCEQVEPRGHDPLTEDIKTLDEFLSDDCISSVHPICSELKSYLKDRQQFWRTQNPAGTKRASKAINSQEAKRGRAEKDHTSDTKKEDRKGGDLVSSHEVEKHPGITETIEEKGTPKKDINKRKED